MNAVTPSAVPSSCAHAAAQDRAFINVQLPLASHAACLAARWSAPPHGDGHPHQQSTLGPHRESPSVVVPLRLFEVKRPSCTCARPDPSGQPSHGHKRHRMVFVCLTELQHVCLAEFQHPFRGDFFVTLTLSMDPTCEAYGPAGMKRWGHDTLKRKTSNIWKGVERCLRKAAN